MNIVILTGRLAIEPELRYTQSGKACVTFPLAVGRQQTKDDSADFPTIVAWQETAEFVTKHLHKGGRVVVRGKLRTRNYDGSDGKNHKATEVYAERIEFADNRPPEPAVPNDGAGAI